MGWKVDARGTNKTVHVTIAHWIGSRCLTMLDSCLYKMFGTEQCSSCNLVVLLKSDIRVMTQAM